MNDTHVSASHGQRGVILVFFALFLMFSLGFVALGIDVAKLMATHTELQNAADAAALAGASAIDMATGTLSPDTALARAQQTAALNRAFRDGAEPVNLLPEDVQFPTPQQVRVTVRRTEAAGGGIVTYFAGVLGIKTLETTATAIAEARETSTPCEGLVPMAPIEPPGSGWFDPDCSQTYQLKVGSGQGQSGNYELLDYPPCDRGPCAGLSGGAAIRCIAEHGYGCCLDEGQEMSLTEPGNKVGPFRQGMQARFDSDTDQREDICFSDYKGNGNRIMPLPVVESFDVNGKKMVRIIKFSAFFIKYRPPGNATLEGQFINDVIPEGDSGQGQGHGTIYVLRLVK